MGVPASRGAAGEWLSSMCMYYWLCLSELPKKGLNMDWDYDYMFEFG